MNPLTVPVDGARSAQEILAEAESAAGATSRAGAPAAPSDPRGRTVLRRAEALYVAYTAPDSGRGGVH